MLRFWYCAVLWALWQTSPQAAPAKPPQVGVAVVMFKHGQLKQVFLNFAQAPKRNGRVLVIVPSSGQRAELAIMGVEPSELDGFDVTLDLTPLGLVGDAKLEYSQLDLIVISPAPTKTPALLKLDPSACPKMIHPSQIQACLDLDVDGKPDLLLAQCCGKGYSIGEDRQIDCNDSLTSQCLWQWQGKGWKLIQQRGPC